MRVSFKNFLEIADYVREKGSLYIPESWTREIGKLLPKLDLGLPSVERRAKIDLVLDKQNPIYIQLADGSKLFFTYDEFRRIEGKPERGKVMVVTMQRRADDLSELPSQIVGCRVL